MEIKSPSSWRSLFTYFSVACCSLLLLIYAVPARYPGLNSRVFGVQRDSRDDVFASITKRATVTYEDALTKGRKLHCLMRMSLEEASASNGGVSLEAAEFLQTDGLEGMEGFVTSVPNEVKYGTYLVSALSGLGITEELQNRMWTHTQQGLIYDDPGSIFNDDLPPDEVNVNARKGDITRARFGNSFGVDSGLIIADTNLAVLEAAREVQLPENALLPHLRRWSDAAWIQWYQLCFSEGKDVSKVKYIIRSWITNHITLRILSRAMISKSGRGMSIGKWSERITLTVDDNPDEFYAVLGTPNGAGSAYLVLTHKRQLGIKTINKIDVWVPNIPLPIPADASPDQLEFLATRKIMLLFHVTDV